MRSILFGLGLCAYLTNYVAASHCPAHKSVGGLLPAIFHELPHIADNFMHHTSKAAEGPRDKIIQAAEDAKEDIKDIFKSIMRFPVSVNDCPSLTPREKPPTSVSDLRPDDIKVIMALGDSVTAGFGALGYFGDRQFLTFNLHEWRGVSFSIGGDSTFPTVANFIKRYSDGLFGSSHGNHTMEICWYGNVLCFANWIPDLDVLNAAQSGAQSVNLVKQIDYIVKLMQNNSNINFEKDWKLLTIAIGANDLCMGCTKGFHSPEEYQNNIRKAIEEVRTKIPRTLINLATPFSPEGVFQLTHNDAHCKMIRGYGLGYECGCALSISTAGNATRKVLNELHKGYTQKIHELDKEYSTKKTDDFALIIDPSIGGVNMASFPVHLVSKLDCFHPSVWGHGYIATMVWNNLFRPKAEKIAASDYVENLQPVCVTDIMRIRTD